jgi:hypothetical protein
MIRALENFLARAEQWPLSAQEELARAAAEIEARHDVASGYRASAEELEGIDEGLAQMRRGELVPEDEMEAFFDRTEP